MNAPLVGLAVTPTVVSTLLSHYINRKPLRHKPTAHLSYDEGLRLIRSFLQHASRHTVEELQAFTAQWVPHPQWVRVDEAVVPSATLERAAELLREQLGPDGLRRVGGEKWWTWRKPGKDSASLRAEWIEMKADYIERKRKGAECNRVMLYVHGGAYYFGSVDEHRYQMQRHARKLKARVFAPRYRLAPQFPFPCGLQDCLAAYLFLLEDGVKPSEVVLAGDSAGGGMVVSMLVTMRDRGVPMPAGAVLISPCVDLTHSFPSVAGEAPLDYIPQCGFHHRPSEAWPPPDEAELEVIKNVVVSQKQEFDAEKPGQAGRESAEGAEGVPTIKDVKETTQRLSLVVDGQHIEIREQIQIYTTNELLAHPLVSPVLQPTLGGLPPLLIMVGGGEILRDEQIYLAHKCANPEAYLPAESLLDDYAREQIRKYKPTDVQLQVWEDLCHVAPTLSFTRPAKYMYRSVAQFGAWVLARAQETAIEILDDDDISVISGSSGTSDREEERGEKDVVRSTSPDSNVHRTVGRAGDAIPPFIDHMVRQRITRHGDIFPLPPAEKLPGCMMPNHLVGVVKQGPVKKWLDQKRKWDTRYRSTKERVHAKRVRDAKAGFESFGAGEMPPPSALAGRRKIGGKMMKDKKQVRSYWLSVWGLWGSKHDEMTVKRERAADREEVEIVDPNGGEAKGVERTEDGVAGDESRDGRSGFKGKTSGVSRSRSRRRTVTDQNQTGSRDGPDNMEEDAAPYVLSALGKEMDGNFLSPDYMPDTGVTGKRPRVDGIAMPFSIKKEAETASMITLNSGRVSKSGTPRPMSPVTLNEGDGSAGREEDGYAGGSQTPALERPGLETFVTAAEDLPKVNGTAAE